MDGMVWSGGALGTRGDIPSARWSYLPYQISGVRVETPRSKDIWYLGPPEGEVRWKISEILEVRISLVTPFGPSLQRICTP